MTADLLRRAADLLTDLALEATPGPWVAGPHNYAVFYDGDSDVARHRGDQIADTFGERNALWIALMDPGIAQTLARWLRAEAASASYAIAYVTDNGTREPTQDEIAALEERHRHPAALARALLGETE